MRYFLSLLVLVLVEAQIRINHFNAVPSATVLHQVNTSLLIVGTKNGNLISYTPKGQLLNEQQEPHRVAITSIESIQIDNSSYMMVSDKQGCVSMWKDGSLKQIINKQGDISEIVAGKFSQASVLAINMKQSIDIHQIPTLKLIKTISNQGSTFKKTLLGQKNEIYVLVQSWQGSSIYIYNISDKFWPIIIRQKPIVDFAISVSQDNYYLFLIDTSKNIEIYALDSNYKIKNELNLITNKLISSSYSSVVHLKNNKELPLFVATKIPQQIQFFNGFDITLFLQLNAEIKTIHSTLNQSLILLGNNGQVTSITMGEPTDEPSYWIVFFTLILLAVGLYLCCRDCCPGVIQRWKMNEQRKEIELQLYRQRTDLQNF